jgi:hypothetical protein
MAETRNEAQRLLLWIRVCIIGAMVIIALSGITAFPLARETAFLDHTLQDPGLRAWLPPALVAFIGTVAQGVAATTAQYPFIFYGTDWLAFGHLVIALCFLGPLRDPVRNVWVVEWAIWCCVLVIPAAAIMGPIRGIPWWWWGLIDCAFAAGAVPLLILRRLIVRYGQVRSAQMGKQAETLVASS